MYINILAALANTEKISNRGVPGGYAGLDAGGLVPMAHLPANLGSGSGVSGGNINLDCGDATHDNIGIDCGGV